jgi:Tol biopolymer transport system component
MHRPWEPAVSRKTIYALLVSFVLIGAFAAGGYWLNVPPRLPSVTIGRELTHDGLVKSNLASDGSHLYFTEISGSRSVIAKVPAAGGEISPYPLAFPNAQLLDVSAAHASLLAAEETSGSSVGHPVWLSPLSPTSGGDAKRFGNTTAQEAVWSPDGQSVLTVNGSSLFVSPADGGAAKKLVTIPGSPYYPRYSPDGQRIRFSVGDVALSTSTIWEMRNDGSDLHQILADWHAVTTKCCGSWTADGRYYLFQATASELGSTANLWALAEQTEVLHKAKFAEPVELTRGAVSFGKPVPSADNSKIWSLGLKLRGTVVKYDMQSKQYVPFLSGISATDLDFSSDGQWIAYISVPDGALWRCRTDGSQAKRLTSNGARAALPRWSRDSKQIAYVNIQTGKPWTIFLIPASGGTPQPLLAEDKSEVDINWSLAGDQIIFGRITERKAEGLSIEVYDLKTHTLSSIPGSEGLFSPRLSPDGHYIAALSANLTKLMLYDTQTKKWSEWQTVASGALNYPAWSEDSKSIYFDDLVSGEGSYCRANVGESHYDRVLVLSGLERYLGVLGLWSGRTPDGSPLFVKDASTGEVFELAASLP